LVNQFVLDLRANTKNVVGKNTEAKVNMLPKNDDEMVIWLHDQARKYGNNYFREVADRFNELSKLVKQAEREAQHKAVQG
jgi:hypothetical protein